MTEGFLGGLNRQLIFWAGWVFTVGGAAISLGVGGQFAWIGALCVVTGLLALMTFAHQKHQELRQAQERQEAAKQQYETALRAAVERAEQAERKLNEVSREILLQLQATVEGQSFANQAALVAEFATYVKRMCAFEQASGRPLTLKVFVKRAGKLYTNAKLSADAMTPLREEDRFLMEFKNPSGLFTPSAVLEVWQLEPVKETIWLRVTEYRSDELKSIEVLADRQEVQAKGYTARPLCDLALYTSLNLTDAEAAIRVLTGEFLQLREKAKP
jgi:hypothetical protein